MSFKVQYSLYPFLVILQFSLNTLFFFNDFFLCWLCNYFSVWWWFVSHLDTVMVTGHTGVGCVQKKKGNKMRERKREAKTETNITDFFTTKVNFWLLKHDWSVTVHWFKIRKQENIKKKTQQIYKKC